MMPVLAWKGTGKCRWRECARLGGRDISFISVTYHSHWNAAGGTSMPPPSMLHSSGEEGEHGEQIRLQNYQIL
jgi:hypothetical protein